MCYKCETDDETYNPKTNSCNSCMPNLKPHKHAALIKAWAENTDLVVQCRPPKAGKFEPAWITIPKGEPIQWSEDLEYRIKPPTIKFRNALMRDGGDYFVWTFQESSDSPDQDYFIKWLGGWQEVEV